MYFVLSLLRNEKRELPLGNDFDDMDNMNFGENSNDIFNDEDGLDEVAKSSDRPLLWQMEVMNDIGNTNSAEIPYVDSFNDNDTSVKPCRNSVQGKFLIVDEKGYMCTTYDILPNGCCNTNKLEKVAILSSSVPSVKKTRYSCKSCNPQGCCEIYEYCVSCCLDPNKIQKKKNPILEQIRKENIKLRRGEDILKLRLRSLDRFQLCLAVCRTSSTSVKHENTYKNPNFKHCYLLQLPSSAQRHKRNSIIINNHNNNENDLRIAFTPFSAVNSINLNSILCHKYPVLDDPTICMFF